MLPRTTPKDFLSPYDLKKRRKMRKKGAQFIGRALPLAPRKMPEIEQKYEISEKPEASEQSPRKGRPLTHSELGVVLAEAKILKKRPSFSAGGPQKRTGINRDLLCVRDP